MTVFFVTAGLDPAVHATTAAHVEAPHGWAGRSPRMTAVVSSPPGHRVRPSAGPAVNLIRPILSM
jgi:hypothetical protein